MKSYAIQLGFHDLQQAALEVRPLFTWREDTEYTYTFENFFHPFVGELIEKLNKESLPAMLDPVFLDALDQSPDTAKVPPNSFFKLFDAFYKKPANSDLAVVEGFPKEIDVLEGGPYANYNWELLFHIPLTIAVHLSKNQRFAEAQRWFHYIFDPTSNDTSIPPPQRFWKFLAFRRDDEVTQIDELLALLSKPASESTPNEIALKEKILTGYAAITDKPFQPHRVARTRHLAYQYCVVMKYLDNLIAWGDSLFRQDTIESINEATQRYVLAANILGTRPQRIPSKGVVRPKTFAQLHKQGLDPMGNALVELEAKFPFNLGLPQTQGIDPTAVGPLFGIGRTLYFCIPRNDKLLGYWDTVADRLFKIRHCMNIEGVVRQLALFDPPLDPGMLVKATAAGIDVGSMVNGLNQPISPLRCVVLIQKALEMAAEVRGLGNALLSAVERGDGERLALLRQGHEIKIQQMQQEVRFLQWKQTQESTESLLRSRSNVVERYRYYQRLLGLPPNDNVVPDTFPLERSKLTEENFDEAYDVLVGQYDKTVPIQAYPRLKMAGDTSPAILSGAAGQSKLYLNTNENADLNEHAVEARSYRNLSALSDSLAQGLALIPNPNLHVHYWGLGGSTGLPGGTIISAAGHIVASSLSTKAAHEDSQGASASKSGSYERRADDWMLQSNLAARELMQLGRQIISSLIAEQIAHHEYETIQKQIEQSQEVDRFLHEKFTNEELHTWMQGELARLYYEYYRFAFDTARKAEQTMKRELMRPEVDTQDFVKFNYWDAGRKGLLSGEALYLDVKRMEMAYHDNNKRELELTRHVSLRQLDPLALLTLKSTGTCTVTIPEWLYDRDCPGHYMRRIKTVALSMPSVAGPYSSVNCTVSLLRSSVRKSSTLTDGEYARQGADDARFVDYSGAVQSIVTSGASADSGMFETNLRDERFLPFEGAGAESTWRLELPKPKHYPAFDYATITDVILHVRYTARQGVDSDKVTTALKDLFGALDHANLALLFSLRHDFPTEWSAFVKGTANFSTTIRKDHFPYFTQGKTITISGLELYAQDVTKHHPVNGIDLDAVTSNLNDPTQARFTLTAGEDTVEPKILTRTANADVFLIIRYSLEG